MSIADSSSPTATFPLQSLPHDFRYAIRILAKSPAFTIVAVLTLALGIGANTAIFSVINAVLLRPLSIHDPATVLTIHEEWRGSNSGVAAGSFNELRSHNSAFSSLAVTNMRSFNLAAGPTPERIDGETVSSDYFAVLGVQPLAGRPFTADEDQPGRAPVALLSENLWRTRFHSDPAIVGSTITLNGATTTVLGVMPKSFDPVLNKSQIWTPIAFTPEQKSNFDSHYLTVLARLKPGITLAQAQAELNVTSSQITEAHPLEMKERTLHAYGLAEDILGDQRAVLRMMLAAVGLVLLIACANIANLQLARSRTRQKEMAMRSALGASPARIIRQLLAENIVLGLAGGVVGVALAYWGVSWIVARGPADVPRLDQSTVDARALIFALFVSLFASFLFGLAPAIRSASTRLGNFLNQSAGTINAGIKDRVRSALVIAEVALALLLMAGAGLLFRSALVVSHVNPGFQPANLVVGRVGLPEAGYQDPNVTRHTFERIADAATALPGVESAAIVSRMPMGDGWSSNGLLAEGKPLDPVNLVNAEIQIVSPSYLDTVRIPLKVGRNFTAQDLRSTTLVTIVNETLARTMWPNENPIGKRFACCENGPKGRLDPVWHEVVGVVADVRAQGLDQKVMAMFYLPIEQMPPDAGTWLDRSMDIVLRTRNTAFPANDLRAAVSSIAPGVPVYALSTMQQVIAGTLASSHFDTFLLAIFAVIALALSSIGIYGVLSYVVAQRTRDIGIRMALGATRAVILRDVLSYGLRLAAIGLALGIVAALAGTRLLASLLFGVQPTDPITLISVSLLLAFFAFIAGFLPARRATRLDPMSALRYE
jgi:putative ABC transport system permease protein